MRHGARLDKADPDWESTAGRDRPYDPPLTDSGKTEAFQMATVKYRDKVRFSLAGQTLASKGGSGYFTLTQL